MRLNSNHIKPEDIESGMWGLTSGRSVLSRGIQLFEGSRINHALSFVRLYWKTTLNDCRGHVRILDAGLYVVEADGSSSWQYPGVEIIDFHNYIRVKHDQVLLLKIPLVEMHPVKQAEFVDFMMKQIGKKYDYRAFLSQAARYIRKFFGRKQDKIRGHAERWYCSELAAAGQNILFGNCKNYNDLTPSDMMDIQGYANFIYNTSRCEFEYVVKHNSDECSKG